jgi:2-aminoadipate transaminase
MADQTVYDFGSGKPSPKTFPSEALGRAAQRVIAREGPMLSSYPEARGYVPLREIGVQRFARNHGMNLPFSDVITTNGSMQAIILATQAFAPPGDTVLVEEYCYGGTLGVLRQFGARVEGVALDDAGMRADALDAALERNKREGRRVGFVYSIATHQNPTGTIMPMERRQEIVAVCRRHEVLLVEDDCYADVVFEGQMPRAMYTLAEPGTCLYIGSFSKILGPGVRLGYSIAPESLTAKMLAFKRDGGTSNLSSMVVAEYMKDELWTHAAEVCDAVRHKRDILFSALEREMGGLVEWTRPKGGLFTWLKLPEGIDTQAIASLAKDRNVMYATGKAFDAADRDVPFLRLAFGYIDDELIDDGVALLGECIEGAAPGAAVAAKQSTQPAQPAFAAR